VTHGNEGQFLVKDPKYSDTERRGTYEFQQHAQNVRCVLLCRFIKDNWDIISGHPLQAQKPNIDTFILLGDIPYKLILKSKLLTADFKNGIVQSRHSCPEEKFQKHDTNL
jgi:hypothetical protein